MNYPHKFQCQLVQGWCRDGRVSPQKYTPNRVREKQLFLYIIGVTLLLYYIVLVLLLLFLSWGRSDLFGFHFHITEGNQDKNSSWAGTWRQELMQSAWRGVAYSLAHHGLLTEHTITSPRMFHPQWDGPPHHSQIKKMPHRLVHSPHFMEAVS